MALKAKCLSMPTIKKVMIYPMEYSLEWKVLSSYQMKFDVHMRWQTLHDVDFLGFSSVAITDSGRSLFLKSWALTAMMLKSMVMKQSGISVLGIEDPIDLEESMRCLPGVWSGRGYHIHLGQFRAMGSPEHHLSIHPVIMDEESFRGYNNPIEAPEHPLPNDLCTWSQTCPVCC